MSQLCDFLRYHFSYRCVWCVLLYCFHWVSCCSYNDNSFHLLSFKFISTYIPENSSCNILQYNKVLAIGKCYHLYCVLHNPIPLSNICAGILKQATPHLMNDLICYLIMEFKYYCSSSKFTFGNLSLKVVLSLCTVSVIYTSAVLSYLIHVLLLFWSNKATIMSCICVSENQSPLLLEYISVIFISITNWLFLL